jgi:hypothetical protein
LNLHPATVIFLGYEPDLEAMDLSYLQEPALNQRTCELLEPANRKQKILERVFGEFFSNDAMLYTLAKPVHAAAYKPVT